MTIQSLSIAVPAPCPNKCGFCVAHMHEETYVNHIERNLRFRDLYKRDYRERLAFARDNGCNTLMFTGNGEALMNKRFIEEVADLNRGLSAPFRILELQTSGITLDDEVLRWLRNTVGVSTISLSMSSIWDSTINSEYNGTPEKLRFAIDHLCSEIKRYDFNLRLSLNMTDAYNHLVSASSGGSKAMEAVFTRARDLGANQITFRKLYKSGENPDSPENRWIDLHGVADGFWPAVTDYITTRGRKLERLPFGAWRYAVHDMSCVVDDDCMSTETRDELKYLILRPNCKLYTKWDEPGSLLF